MGKNEVFNSLEYKNEYTCLQETECYSNLLQTFTYLLNLGNYLLCLIVIILPFSEEADNNFNQSIIPWAQQNLW